jgi:hypothetical protein
MHHQIALELQQTRTGYDTVLLSRERQLGIFDHVIIGPAASPVSFEGIPPCGFRGQNQATRNGCGIATRYHVRRTLARTSLERLPRHSPAVPNMFRWLAANCVPIRSPGMKAILLI